MGSKITCILLRDSPLRSRDSIELIVRPNTHTKVHIQRSLIPANWSGERKSKSIGEWLGGWGWCGEGRGKEKGGGADPE